MLKSVQAGLTPRECQETSKNHRMIIRSSHLAKVKHGGEFDITVFMRINAYCLNCTCRWQV